MGNHLEANEELERIAAVNRAHPEVIRLWWRIYARANLWNDCLEIARGLKPMDPEHRFGWLHEAMNFDKLGRAANAKKAMLEAIDHFGPNSTLAFHLACLAARTGSLQEARDWVGKAIELAEDQETLDRLRLRVLDEPTLEAIWKDSQDRKGGLK